MGACHAKKQRKSTEESNSIQIFEQQHNLINMGLGKIKMDNVDYSKLYNKMLEPLKLTTISMQNADTKSLDHYFKSSETQKSNLSALKTQIIRQLPIQLSNSIFIRQASQNQNFFKALISGSDNTPYANGLFLYDIFLPENYPTACPKMQLITTGRNQIRFNPNLYSSGYVCLSLLGTWRGDSVESWNPTSSNLLQVLLSVQSLVMSEGISYNEPSHENDYKTPLGKSRNVGYSNIVRYATVRYAINEMIQNPPKGFEDIVKLHFAIKSNLIMKTLEKWVENAQQDNASAAYDGIVNSHNQSLAEEFKKNSSAYYNKLKVEVDITKNLFANLVQSLVQTNSKIFLEKVEEEEGENKKKQQENEEKGAEVILQDNANQEKGINSNNKEENTQQLANSNKNSVKDLELQKNEKIYNKSSEFFEDQGNKIKFSNSKKAALKNQLEINTEKLFLNKSF